ncbi:hypothetical protein YC2023_066053 [Brassica napus]
MITVNWSCDMEQGHEDTMMGSHPGGRAGDLTLGREGTALASGDRKYSENLRSTIEEHRPCHFRSYTIAYTGRLWLSVCVRVCPSVHTERPWLSISTHISTLVLGLSMLALPVDCLGDFGPRGLSVQYTQDVRGCPPAHTRRLWLFVAVRQHTQDVCGCPCMSLCVRGSPPAHTGRPSLSVAVRQHTQDVHVCPSAQTGRPCVSVSTHRTSVCVRQHTQDVCGLHTGRPRVSASTHRMSVAVCGCPKHISTLVLGLSTLALPVDYSGDFGRRGQSVQYTQDVRGCPSVDIGRPCASVSTHRTSVAVRVCTSPHRTSVAVHHTHRTSVGVRQHTQDIRGCPWVSVSTHRTFVAVRVCPSVDTGRPWLSISTHISTFVLGLSTLAHPMDCLGDFGPRGLSVQYTQAVCGCPPAHTGRPWLFVSTHRMSVAVRQHTQDVRGYPCVSVCDRQHTQDVYGCPSVHISACWSLDTARWPFPWTVRGILATWAVCSVHTGRLWVSVSTHRTSVCVRQHAQDVRGCLSVSVFFRQHTQNVRGCPSVHISARCTHRKSVGVRQYTQDVRGCPPAHTGRLWLSVSKHRTSVAVCVCPYVSVSTEKASVAVHITHRTSVGVRQNTQMTSVAVCGCPSEHTGRLWLSVYVRVCPWVSTRTHRTSVAVRQHTQDVRVCPSAHSGFPCVSVCVCQYTQDVRVCPSVSVSTHRTSVCVRQHTHDICGYPCVSVTTHRTSVAVHQYTQDVRGCLWLSVSTHWTSVAVRVCLSAHTGRSWLSISKHISTLVLGLSTLALPVDYSGDFGPRGQSLQYTKASVGVHQLTQDVRVHPSAHTGRPWLSVCVRHHTGRPWLSISTHISTLVLGLSTLNLPVDCSGDFGPRGLSVQYTQDVFGCPSAHTGRPCVSVSTHRTSVAVCVCPCFSVSTHRSSVAVHQYTYQHFGPWTQHADPSRGLFGSFWPTWAVYSVRTGRPWVSASTHRTSVGARQRTQDVCGCPSANTGRLWLSVCVRMCPSAQKRRLWLSICTHISTLVLELSTLALPVDCLGDFGPRGLSVQYTQDVRGCPPAHK